MKKEEKIPTPDPRPIPPKTMKMKAIQPELHNALIIYLESKPHGEVKNLINALSQSPDIDVTFNEQPATNN